MKYEAKLRKNIYKNYLFAFLTNVDLTHGTWMIYLAFKGMSLFQLGILEGIFHVTSFLMEIPTGAIADIWGRKVSRICGRISSVIYVLLLLFSNNFIMFAISFVFAALSYNLESGAGDALVYDSMKELNSENEYMRINGNNEALMQLGRVGGLVLGGYLVLRGYEFAYGIAALIGVFVIIQSTTFTEPKIKDFHQKEKNVLKVLKKQIIGSIDILKAKKKLGFLIVFAQIIFVFGTTMFYYLQNYFKNNGYSEAKIGIVLAIASLSAALAATQAHKIERTIKEKGILLITPFISVICIWGIALTKLHYVFFIIMQVIDAVIFIALSDYINKLIPSEKRATFLSFCSMIFSFFMILIFPLIGKVGDLYSLELSFKILGIIASVFLIINTYVLLKNERNNLNSLNKI